MNWHNVVAFVIFVVAIVTLVLGSPLPGQAGITFIAPVRENLTLASVGALAVLALYSFIIIENRFHEIRAIERERTQREAAGLYKDASDKSKEALKRLLAHEIARIFVGENPTNIRANVMTKSENNALKIIGSVNMDIYPDKDIRLGIDQGCVGRAWRQASDAPLKEKFAPVVATTADLGAEGLEQVWHLPEALIKITGHILWIISTPIFYSDGGTTRFIGVLSFDGVERPLKKMSMVRNDKIHEKCAYAAEGLGRQLGAGEYAPLF